MDADHPISSPVLTSSNTTTIVPAHQYPPNEEEIPVPVTFGEVSTASYRIRPGIQRTSVTKSRKLSALLNANVYLKREYQHPTGSFKERGGRNAMLLLSPEAKQRGVIAASAGNHALALAYHGMDLNVPVTVVMPTIAPITKVTNCRELGANVKIFGSHIGEAKEFAMKLAREQGLTYINGFDHPHVIAGAGTLGMEILEQVPDVDAVVIPVGGAGLIAGTALAIKSLRPDVKVYGAEPATVPSLTAALEAGKPVSVNGGPTLADGLLVPRVGTNAFALCQQHVDKVVTVREKYIALAMLRLMEMEKAVVEGGGATGLAAMLQGLLPELEGKNVVVPLCGGNVDTPVLGRVLERGLAADGRLVRFEAIVSDRPGGIAALTRLLADAGVSIKDILHERAWVDTDVASVRVKVIVETADRTNATAMFELLQANGYEVDVPRNPIPGSAAAGKRELGTSPPVE
jgi:threonine dehydratase